MKILLLDIETAPHRVYAWGLWDQNIGLNQIEEPGYTLCWAAKWLGSRDMMFASVREGREKMLRQIWGLLDEADVVVHYNGAKFDIPTLNQEFVQIGLNPPGGYRQLDLLVTMRRRFRLASNKLDYVVKQFGIGAKIEHKGMDLWREVMANDPKAWAQMESYNKRDVKLLEAAYKKLRPWLLGHPNWGLFKQGGAPVCPACGSKHLQRRGWAYSRTLRYQRFQCQSCGTWSRGRKHDTPNKMRDSMTVPLDRN